MNPNRETLVILTPAFPADESEDTWVVSQQLFVKTIKTNFPELDVTVLSFFYPYRSSTYSWNDIPVTSFNGMKKRKLLRLGLWKEIWYKLNIIRREHTIKGIFSFWCGECALIGSYFGKRYGLKHLCWICGQDARGKNKWVKFIRPSAGELVAMSPFLATEFYKNHSVKPGHIIPNAIDPEIFPSFQLLQKDIDILGAGSLEIPKQYDVFTEIISTLQKTFSSIKTFHAGMGPEMGHIETLIKERNLHDNLCLLGARPHHEVLKLMQRTKVFLHPSLYEGFSTVCLEALYAGAHVISFCYPLEHPVLHWHVAKNIEHMRALAEEILRDVHTDYNPVQLYTMNESVDSVMKLFEK